MLARRIFRYYFTERQWLMVLNGFIMVFSVAQSGMAQAFINVVFRDSVFQERDQEDELLITWLGMAALGVYTGLSALLGACAAHQVSIDLLVTYFSVSVLMLAPMLLFTFMTFEFQRVFKGWVRHRWSLDQLEELRRFFCQPTDTFDRECMGGPLVMPVNWTSTTKTLTTAYGSLLPPSERDTTEYTIESWCFWEFNQTDCSEIYNDGLERSITWSRNAMYATGGLSAVNILLLLGCLYLTYTIVTPSIIMKSMNTKLNAMMIVPTLGNLVIGLDLMGALASSEVGDTAETDFRKINTNIFTIGRLYVIAGSLTGALMFMGILGDRIRRKKYVCTYLVLMVVDLAILGVGGVWCLFAAHNIREQLKSSNWNGGTFACSANLYGCSNCDYCANYGCDDDGSSQVNFCPEWTKREIIRYVQVYLKMSGLTALSSMIFILAGITSAYTLVQTLREYRCEYI